MADIRSIALPVDIDTGGVSAAEAKKLRSYLYQLTEQLRYVLANLDGDNMSPSYNAGLQGQAAQLTALSESQKEQFAALQKKIVATAAQIAHDYESAVSRSSQQLLATVSERYVARTEDAATVADLLAYADAGAAAARSYADESTAAARSFAGEADAAQSAALAQLVNSQAEQTSREITARFTTVSQIAAQTAAALESWQQQRQTYIRMDENGVQIGKSENGEASPYTMQVDNERLSFCRYGAPVAWFRYDRLYVTAVEAADRLSIGGSDGEGYYDFITTATGLGVKWRAN